MIKKTVSTSEYFKMFDINIVEILSSTENGPTVIFDENLQHAGVYNCETNTVAINNRYLYKDPINGAAVLIHELGHWANLTTGVSPILRGKFPWFQSPDPSDGPYGYAAEFATFGAVVGF